MRSTSTTGPLVFSVKEAAALVGVAEKNIRNEIDRGVMSVSKRPGDRPKLELSSGALLYLLLVGRSEITLSPDDRRAVSRLLIESLAESGRWRSEGRRIKAGVVTIDLGPLREELMRRIDSYRQGLERITSRADVLGGEPVFKDTRISVRHVGKLMERGLAEAKILADFPRLTRDDLAFAQIYARMKPDPGRPKGRLRIRRSAA